MPKVSTQTQEERVTKELTVRTWELVESGRLGTHSLYSSFLVKTFSLCLQPQALLRHKAGVTVN